MAPSPHLVTYRSARLVALVVVLGSFALAGCAQSNTPTEYGSVTESNFEEGCTGAGESSSYCTCTYRVLSGPTGIPYSEFAKIDGQLASRPDSLPDDVQALLRPCSADGGPTTTSAAVPAGP